MKEEAGKITWHVIWHHSYFYMLLKRQRRQPHHHSYLHQHFVMWQCVLTMEATWENTTNYCIVYAFFYPQCKSQAIHFQSTLASLIVSYVFWIPSQTWMDNHTKTVQWGRSHFIMLSWFGLSYRLRKTC